MTAKACFSRRTQSKSTRFKRPLDVGRRWCVGSASRSFCVPSKHVAPTGTGTQARAIPRDRRSNSLSLRLSPITNKQYQLPWTRATGSPSCLVKHRAAVAPSPLFLPGTRYSRAGPHGMPNRSRSKLAEYLPGRPLSCINIRYTTFLFDPSQQPRFNNIIDARN